MAALQTLDGALRHTGLMSELRLREVTGEASRRQSSAELRQDGFIRRMLDWAHKSSYKAI